MRVQSAGADQWSRHHLPLCVHMLLIIQRSLQILHFSQTKREILRFKKYSFIIKIVSKIVRRPQLVLVVIEGILVLFEDNFVEQNTVSANMYT